MDRDIINATNGGTLMDKTPITSHLIKKIGFQLPIVCFKKYLCIHWRITSKHKGLTSCFTNNNELKKY